MPSQTSSILSRSAAATCSPVGVDGVGAVRRAGRCRSRRGGRRWRRCRRRSIRGAARPRPPAGSPRRGRGRSSSTAPCSRGTALPPARRRRSRTRSRPRRRRRRSARRPRRRAPASRLRASAWIPQWPGTTLPEVPPLISPTFAVVPSSRPPRLHPPDRRRGGLDRARAVLRPHPGVRLDPDEVGEDLLLGRRRGDHLADRPGVVEDVADLGAAACSMSKALAPRSPCSSATVRSELDPDRRRLLHPAPHQLHEDRHRGLVVGAEDRVAGAAEDPFVVDDLDPTLVRDGVHVRAEHHVLVALPRHPRQQVSRPRFGRPGGVVLGRPRAPAPAVRPPGCRRPRAPPRSASGSRRAGRRCRRASRSPPADRLDGRG